MPSLPDKRIVFDLDDTLYPERDFAVSGFRAVGDWLGDANFAARCQALFDAGHRRDIFDRALAQAGQSADIADLVSIYRSHTPQIALCPDAVRYLHRHGGRRFGLITDGPEAMQRAKIAALGLEAFCDQIIPTGQWPEGFGKPHPRAFREIAGMAKGRHCVYVADNAAKDFLAPNRLGWITVQILRPERVHEGQPPAPEYSAQHRIDDLDQLDGLLASLKT